MNRNLQNLRAQTMRADERASLMHDGHSITECEDRHCTLPLESQEPPKHGGHLLVEGYEIEED